MWLAALAVLAVRRRPATRPVGAPTLDLGPEPPAVVNFLTHGFRVTPEAVPATLLDLAARGVLELERRGPDVFVCRLGREPEGLSAYEQRVVGLLRRHAHEGIVPPEALTIGSEAEEGRWRKAFDGEVVADAVERGLSRPIAEGRLVAALFLDSFLPGALWWKAVGHHSGLAGLAFVVGAVLLLLWVVSLCRSGCGVALAGRARGTPQGRGVLDAAADHRRPVGPPSC